MTIMNKIFYITSKNNVEAKHIVKSLLKNKLVACANIVKNIDSYFIWKQNLSFSKEVLIVGKTLSNKENKIIKEVKRLHSYDNPCVLFIKISSGNKDFLKWIKNSLK